MSRPVLPTINIGAQGWGPPTVQALGQVYNTPYPVPRHSGTEADLETAYPSALYDECVVWVNHSLIGWTLYYATDGAWAPLVQKPQAGAGWWESSDFYGYTDEDGATPIGTVPPFAPSTLVAGRAQSVALTGMQGSLRLLTDAGGSANSGYRFLTPNLATIYTQTGLAFVGIIAITPDVSGRTIRLGFLDTTDHNDAVDGLYIELSSGTIKGKTASNSTRTTSATAVPVANTIYACRVFATSTASVRFSVWDWINGGAYLLDVNITTNIPTTTTRAFGAGIVATKDAGPGGNICWLDYLGFGTRLPAAFAR